MSPTRARKPETLRGLFLRGVLSLEGLSRPDIDARVLLRHATGVSDAFFHAHPEFRPPARAAASFFKLIARRRTGVPVSRLTGRKEFWSLAFRVRPGVLVPRPETELLVERVVALAGGSRVSILDLGTGSGNVAVALARELPRARITASDISVRALRLAAANAASHGCGRIRFVRSDLFAAFGRPRPRFDIIVSNPPYVPRSDWEGLAAGVRDFEPRRALVGGERGTELTARLVREARRFLKPGGSLVVEFGAGQEKDIRSMFREGWDPAEIFDDLAGIPRVVVARKPAAGAPTSRTPARGSR